MPQGIWGIFCLQIFSTTSFAVLFATLVLYLKQKLGMSSQQADLITGVFFAYNFSLHLLSGSLAGRLLSYRSIVLIGVLFQLLGCVVLMHGTLFALYLGLSLILVGSGTMVTCINLLVSQLFEANDDRRETAFLWNYSGMNVGFLLGFILAGYFQLRGDYIHLFLLTAVANVITLIVLGINWKKFHDRNTAFSLQDSKTRNKYRLYGFLIVIILSPILQVLLRHPHISGILVMAFGIFMYAYILFQGLSRAGFEGGRLLAFLILLGGALMFFVVYQIAPMGLTLFALNNVNRHVFGITIAPGWIQAINTITIIIGGPCLALLFKKFRSRGMNVSIPLQYATGLLLTAIGLFILPLGIHFASSTGYVAFKWIFIIYVIEAMAELCISPIGYSMVGRLAPKKLQGVLMGTVLLNNGVAAVLASHFSNYALGSTHSTNPLVTNPHFSQAFFKLGCVALLFSIVLFLLIPFLRKLIAKAEVVSA